MAGYDEGLDPRQPCDLKAIDLETGYSSFVSICILKFWYILTVRTTINLFSLLTLNVQASCLTLCRQTPVFSLLNFRLE